MIKDIYYHLQTSSKSRYFLILPLNNCFFISQQFLGSCLSAGVVFLICNSTPTKLFFFFKLSLVCLASSLGFFLHEEKEEVEELRVPSVLSCLFLFRHQLQTARALVSGYRLLQYLHKTTWNQCMSTVINTANSRRGVSYCGNLCWDLNRQTAHWKSWLSSP